jgi:hypothetical protein
MRAGPAIRRSVPNLPSVPWGVVRERYQARTAARAADLAPIVKELQAAGKTSLRAIAEGLNAQGIPTARGEGEWTATQVMRVLERLDPFEAAA